ncbi:MAG: response regulator transcription factor [Chloroflexi bacterium]|nr:response regulator transcription factor [Chloroflexota bacterium]
MRVLVVEDERRLAGIIKRGLVEEGYAVDTAFDGEEGQYMAEVAPYDMVILDIMLPKKDGLAVCRELRAKGVNVPILMLTARDKVEDRVKGLDSGADDYMVKPFAFSELLARVRALLRRESMSKTPQLQVGDLVLDTLTREVRRGERKIELTAKEYSMLEYFMRRPNMVVTRTMLEESLWDFDFDSVSNIIDVYIRRLRSKIDEPGEESRISTVRGAGYRMRTA